MTEMWSQKKKDKLLSQFKEASKDFPLLIVVCPMAGKKDYFNPCKRATASYLCNTIVRQCFKGCLLVPNCWYGNGTVLLKDPLKLVF